MQQYSNEVPAHILARAGLVNTDKYTAGIGTQRGPHITTKGNNFGYVGPDNIAKAPLNMQGQGLYDPQRGVYIDIVLVDAAEAKSKVYYEKGFQDGESAPPDCWSNDGLEPDRSIMEPVNDTCYGCPKDIFGSSINQVTGAKGKACSDRKRLAVLNLYDIQGPVYEFSISPSNLTKWAGYAAEMASRVPGGVETIVTRVFVDRTKNGALIFEPAVSPSGVGMWYLTEGVFNLVDRIKGSAEVRKAIGDDRPTMLALNGPQGGQAQLGAVINQPQAQLPAPEAPKRVRRTKVQIEAEKQLLAEAGGVSQQAQPPLQHQQQVQHQPQLQQQPYVPTAVTQPAHTPQPDPMASIGGAVAPSGDAFAPNIPPRNADPMGGALPEIPQNQDRRNEAQPNIAFGVATNVPGASPEIDAMMSQLLGS